jgi:hypothetical protein
VFKVGEQKAKGMNRLLLLFLIPVVLMTGCSSQDTEGAIDTSEGLNPGAISEDSIEVETALLTALGTSCEKAIAEGATEATADGVRMVLLPENLAYESYKAFYQTSEGESELIFSLDFFLVCDLHLSVANFLDQNSEAKQADFPFEVSALGTEKFAVSLDGVSDSQRTYLIRNGLLAEVILAEGTAVSINYGKHSPEDLVEIENLVNSLYD